MGKISAYDKIIVFKNLKKEKMKIDENFT